MTMESNNFFRFENFLLILLLNGIYLPFGKCSSSFEKDSTFTHSERNSLAKFRERVINRLPHDYMKKDIYLIRWLRARKFDIDQAEGFLINNLEWRKRNQVDGILEEDFSDIWKDFPYYLDTFSRDGKPLFSANFGKWDIHRAVLAGKLPKLSRYIIRIWEDMATTVRNLRESGKNVTQFDFICDLEGYNLIQQGCILCTPYYLTVVNVCENHYPGLGSSYIAINVPPVFQIALSIMRPFMSTETREVFQVLGKEKDAWEHALAQIADKDQLSPEFGGTFRRLKK